MTSNASNSGAAPGVGLPVGSKIGKYEVVERSGSGGQAIVYKCYDRALDRYVAAKQISPHLAEDPKFIERFRREAQILAKLGGEGTSLVAIHDLLEEPAGLFIVMEFVQGPTLETVLRDTAGPTEPKAALQVLWRLAAALHAVHAAGIIHRDLKPGNIIVSEGLRPKITDFGVAASRTGQTSMVLGTTKYMAPELFSGGEVDGRADQYSLGIIAYELLLGRPKFKEVFFEILRDPHSEPLRWMKWHSNDQEKAPLLHELNPEIPEGLSQIVAKMMSKNRDDRFENMEALGRAIREKFGPRAKADAASAPSLLRSKRKRAKLAAALAAKSKAGAGKAGDDGDELDITAAATAPLPRKQIPLRTKIVAGAAAFVVLLGVVIALVVRAGRENRRVNDAAMTLYQAGEANLAAGRFEDALSQFEQVPPRFPGTRWAAKAVVMVPLTRSRQAERDANSPAQWESVAQAEADAQTAAANLQKSTRDGELVKFAHDIIDQIGDAGRGRPKLRIFREKIAEADAAYAHRRYAEVAAILSTLTGLSEAQQKQADELRKRAALADFQARYAAEIARGDEAAKINDFALGLDYATAKKAYDVALELVRSSGDLILPVDVDARTKELARKVDRLNQKRDYRKAVADLAAADSPDSKVQALQTIRDILPTPENEQALKQAQADRLVKRAADALAARKPDDARREAQAALDILPDYAPARQIIDRMEKGESRQKLIADGAALYTQGKHAEALKKYLEASELGADDDLTARIQDCQFQLKLREADRLRDDAKFDDAIKVLEEARALKPAESALVDARQGAVRTAKDYRELMSKGDDAMKVNQYSKAREFFRQAAAKAQTPEAKQKIALAAYWDNFTMGKDALGQKTYDIARAYLATAKNYAKDANVDPAEVDKLIQQAEEGVKGGRP